MQAANSHKPLIIWLYFCAFMVFAMMIIGAITRLTESGLSMVEWRPLIGALPPLSEAEWIRVFEIYKETPEFQKKNSWMGLADFKYIFFWEWFHRLWGRLIGIAFALPLLVFWAKGMVPQNYKLKFLGMLALGGAQGVMGWYMVKSGLIDIPAVSHFRLAAHLSLAFLILGLLIWLARSLTSPPQYSHSKLFKHGIATLGILGVTIIWGAFTAGLDGGLIYNSWPMMGDTLIPAEVSKGGLEATLFNPAGVQFAHRWLAFIAAFAVMFFWYRCMCHNINFKALNIITILVVTQVILGITTLLSGVNIVLATLHQGTAALLVGFMIVALYEFSAKKA